MLWTQAMDNVLDTLGYGHLSKTGHVSKAIDALDTIPTHTNNPYMSRHITHGYRTFCVVTRGNIYVLSILNRMGGMHSKITIFLMKCHLP